MDMHGKQKHLYHRNKKQNQDTLKKIVLIGPVYPYKGGIAHYTGLMHQALAKKYNVHMLSYKMQYPHFLFKKEQKDYSNGTFRVDDTDYFINTANPINWIRTASHIQALNPDLVIIQWWHPYFAPCYWFVCKLLRQKRILFICHNVFPHERFPLDRLLTKAVLKNGDYFIVQSATDETDLKSIKPNAAYARTVHPTYNAFKIQNLSREESRRLLNIHEKEQVLLFFGFVREYKGLKHLLYAMPKITAALENIKLLIVGDFDNNKGSYLKIIGELGIDHCIEIHDGYIPDREVEKYFAASDLVVLPYESATQSGIVQIAYGFGIPVIATDVGGLPEVVTDGKTGYIVPPGDSDQLAMQIIRFFSERKAEFFRENIKSEAAKYSWERMTEIIEKLFKAGEKVGEE